MPVGARGSGLRPELTKLAKMSLRGYGVATAALRTKPDFLIIGAKRAGTTSLWNHVIHHPNTMPMFPARLKIKGTGYLSVNHQRGEAWFRSHFPTDAARSLKERRESVRPLCGEATPYYLFHPHAPRRARTVVPDAKLVVILRNPTDRAYSHYRERVRAGVEALTFEDALEAEEERLAGEEERILADERYYSFAHEHFSYVRQGLYADSLVRWFSYFEPGRFLILLNEDLDMRRDHELGRVWDFLGLPGWNPPEIRRYNYHPGEQMSSAARERLLQTFAQANDELARMLGMNLSAWRT